VRRGGGEFCEDPRPTNEQSTNSDFRDKPEKKPPILLC
jgi:hypothetical protein